MRTTSRRLFLISNGGGIQDFPGALDIFFQNLHAYAANRIRPKPIKLHRQLIREKHFDPRTFQMRLDDVGLG